jgi:hypothetical protein
MRRELVKWYADPRERGRKQAGAHVKKASSVKSGIHSVRVSLAADRTRSKRVAGASGARAADGGGCMSQRTSEPVSVMAAARAAEVFEGGKRGKGRHAGQRW